MSTRKLRQWTAVLFLVLLINTAYIAAFNSPTIFYMGNVLLHLVLGVVLTVALLFLLRQFPAAAGFFLAAAALGVFIAVRGNTSDHRWALMAHIVAAAIGLAALAPFAMRQTPDSGRPKARGTTSPRSIAKRFPTPAPASAMR